MAQQTPFTLPWPLHYQHREPGAASAPAPARRDLYEPPPLLYAHARQQAPQLADQHTLVQCKGEEDPSTDYREHYHVHRCSATYGKCGEGTEREREEPVSSTEPPPWDEKLVSSSLCAPAAPAPRDAASPHQHVTTTHAGSAGGRRGALQLWQFLVSLLAEGARCVAWTGRGLEFKLHEPEEVARRWGAQKNRPAMNYDKLSRSLRYYYEKGIMQKVAGERYVYKFVCDPEALFSMASPPPRARSPLPPQYDVLSLCGGGYQYLPPPTQHDYQRRYYPLNQLGPYDT